jgi:hypothetical protein
MPTQSAWSANGFPGRILLAEMMSRLTAGLAHLSDGRTKLFSRKSLATSTVHSPMRVPCRRCRGSSVRLREDLASLPD